MSTEDKDEMIETSSPTVWRRWLATALRGMRDSLGISQKEAGKRCGWSHARISYVENAQQNVTEDDLEKMLAVYGVAEDRWPVYFDASQRSRDKGWWERYDQREVPDWLSLYVGLEQGAAMLRSYEPQVIHGLLQTPDYAAELLRGQAAPRTDEQVASLVELRIHRQEALTRETEPLELSVVHDEVALRRIAGNAETMAAQLRHVVEVAERPNVTVRILPFSTGAHGYTIGQFHMLGFGWPGDRGVVYTENCSGALYLEDAHEIDGHALVFQHLSVLALQPNESVEMIRAVAEEYARG